jgi:two-component system NtrC family sensor kinase
MNRASGRPSRRGIRTEVLLSLGMLMAGAAALLGAASFSASERLVLEQRRESLTQTATALGQALAAAAASGRGETALAATVRRLALDLSLDALVVVDGEARILASSRGEGRGTVSSDPGLRRALQEGRMVTPGEAEGGGGGGRPADLARSWTFAAPLPAGSGPRGAFCASFPVEDLRDALRLHRLAILVFALLDVGIILLFGSFLLGKVAVRPLQGMAKAAQDLAEGRRGARAPVAGSREVVSLAESFNRMADRVEESAQRQEEHLAALTRAHHELRSAQEELVRAEKLASVGRLAAGVAHEIGNPLSAILGYAGLLLREKPAGEAAEYLRHIERETERIRRIIADLLEFSRPREAMGEEISINQVVESALDLVRPQPEFRQVIIAFAAGDGLPPVRGDRHHLCQVLVNLLANAAQAMDGRGELAIATAVRAAATEERCPRRRATDGHPPAGRPGAAVVSVSVRDSGPGVAPEAAGRVFDPFFTTKATGQGTGLGLSIAWGIVAAHHGTLRLADAGGGGRGAEFVMELPVMGTALA